jgi:hypothetical protein
MCMCVHVCVCACVCVCVCVCAVSYVVAKLAANTVTIQTMLRFSGSRELRFGQQTDTTPGRRNKSRDQHIYESVSRPVRYEMIEKRKGNRTMIASHHTATAHLPSVTVSQ